MDGLDTGKYGKILNVIIVRDHQAQGGRNSVATGSEFPVPGRFWVLQSRVRAGYGYTLKFETRVPGTLRVIGG